MNKLMDGRKLVNALGIPGWLFLIWKGEIFYAAFILVVVVLGLGEFYNLTMKKGAKPLRWVGMVSSVFIIDYYYVQPSLTSHQIFGCILLVIIITLIWELFSNKEEPIVNILWPSNLARNISEPPSINSDIFRGASGGVLYSL